MNADLRALCSWWQEHPDHLRPKPAQDLKLAQHGQFIEAFHEFWTKHGKGVLRAIKREQKKQRRTGASAVSALKEWFDRNAEEHHRAYVREAEKSKAEAARLRAAAAVEPVDGTDRENWKTRNLYEAEREEKAAEGWGEAAKYCQQWTRAWRDRIERFEADPLACPLVELGVPEGGDEVPGRISGGLFAGPSGKQPDGSDDLKVHWVEGKPTIYASANHIDYLDRSFVRFESGPPREFIEALKAQSRSVFWVVRTLQAIHELLCGGSVDTAFLCGIATSRIVYDWHMRMGMSPLVFGERRDEDGRRYDDIPYDERRGDYFDFFGRTDWVHRFANARRTPSARDAEWCALILAALIEHVVAYSSEHDASAPIHQVRITIRRDPARKSAKWLVDANGDRKSFTCGPAYTLVTLGDNSEAEIDERHVTSLCRVFPWLGALFDKRGKRIGRTSRRRYSTPALKGSVVISQSDRAKLEEESAAAARRARGRKTSRHR
jgi:hypothetical protein